MNTNYVPLVAETNHEFLRIKDYLWNHLPNVEVNSTSKPRDMVESGNREQKHSIFIWCCISSGNCINSTSAQQKPRNVLQKADWILRAYIIFTSSWTFRSNTHAAIIMAVSGRQLFFPWSFLICWWLRFISSRGTSRGKWNWLSKSCRWIDQWKWTTDGEQAAAGFLLFFHNLSQLLTLHLYSYLHLLLYLRKPRRGREF